MTDKNKRVRGSVFASGHQALTRGILKDSDVTVKSRGNQFYNKNDFPVMYWYMQFFEYYLDHEPDNISRQDIERIWREARQDLTRDNEIVIAETPEWVDRRYMDQLDGGILHESFHSLYSVRGQDLDLDRIAEIMDAHFDPDVDYAARAGSIKKFDNIYEDAMIERIGLDDFKGASRKIQVVHELIWEREKYARRYRPMGHPMVDEDGNPIKDDDGEPIVDANGDPKIAMSGIDHLSCYIRDTIQDYLNDPPIDEYKEEVKGVVDQYFADLIEEAGKLENSYDTFELSLRTVNRMANLFPKSQQHRQNPNGQGQGQQQQGEGQDQGQQQQQGQGQGQGQSQEQQQQGQQQSKRSSQNGSGQQQSSSGDEQSQGQGGGDQQNSSPSNKDDEKGEEGGSDGEEESESEEGGEGQSGQKADDGDEESGQESGQNDEEGDQESPFSQNMKDDRGPGKENERRETPENQPEDEYKGEDGEDEVDIDDDLIDQLSDPNANHEGMEDVSSALKQEWDDQVSTDAPPSVLPFSREYDEVIHIDPNGTREEKMRYNEIEDKVREDTLYIRPRMLSFFRGQQESRLRHRQEKGNRLSSRSVSEVVYKERPRPFMTKEKTERRDSAVSLILDESGSMNSKKSQARRILTTLAVTIGELRIPMEIIGFTTARKNAMSQFLSDNPDKDTREFRDEIAQKFTRTQACRYRIFREFDEPFNIESYRKLIHTDANNVTPIPDAIEFSAKRILQRQEEQKIMFVVTDGKPVYRGVKWSDRDYLNIMESQVEQLKQDDVEVLFVGVGDASFVDRYPNSVYIDSMENFASKMAGFIFEQMKRVLSEERGG